MKFQISPSPIETARALILHILKGMREEPLKMFYIAFSGGSTPSLMYKLWKEEYKDKTSWKRIHIFWVDERCVPANNPESNYGVMRSLLLDHVPLLKEQIHPIIGENDSAKEAIRYSNIVKEKVPLKAKLPIFDMVLLGTGNDGHTSSIFPGQEELLTSSYLYAPSKNPYSGQKRIALTGQPIIHSNQTIFLITGKEKANVVYDICTSKDSGPAAYIAVHSKKTTFFLDKDAAMKS